MVLRVIQDVKVTEKWNQVKYKFPKGRSQKTNSLTVFDKGISLLGKTGLLVLKTPLFRFQTGKKDRGGEEKGKTKKGSITREE